MSVSQSVCLVVCLSIRPSDISLSLSLSLSLSFSLSLSVCLSVSLSIYLSLSLSLIFSSSVSFALFLCISHFLSQSSSFNFFLSLHLAFFINHKLITISFQIVWDSVLTHLSTTTLIYCEPHSFLLTTSPVVFTLLLSYLSVLVSPTFSPISAFSPPMTVSRSLCRAHALITRV